MLHSEEKSVRYSSASTRDEGKGLGAPDDRAGVSLQPMGDYVRANVHSAAHGGPHDGAGECSLKEMQPMQVQQRSRFSWHEL